MEANDLLNLKTTNIYIRISPLLKMKLIERGDKMGINLSDYIGYILTKDMNGQNEPAQSEEYKELEKKNKLLHTELMRYIAIAKPYEDWIGKEVTIDGKTHRFEQTADILYFIAKHFKVKS